MVKEDEAVARPASDDGDGAGEADADVEACDKGEINMVGEMELAGTLSVAASASMKAGQLSSSSEKSMPAMVFGSLGAEAEYDAGHAGASGDDVRDASDSSGGELNDAASV